MEFWSWVGDGGCCWLGLADTHAKVMVPWDRHDSAAMVDCLHGGDGTAVSEESESESADGVVGLLQSMDGRTAVGVV